MTKTLKVIAIIGLFSFLLYSCKSPETDFRLQGSLILLDSINVDGIDSVQYQIIQGYRAELAAEMGRLLVYSEQVIERGTPEGLLNNFVADLVLEKGHQLYSPADEHPIDFCLLNYGGLRVPLPKGEITFERVFELLPFENEMVVITLSGEKILELFQYLSVSSVGMPLAGARLTIANGQPASILIQDQEFDIKRNYKVLTSDYLAGGGDSMGFFLQPLNYELLGMRVRDAIIHHMQQVHKRGERITSQLDGRISYL